MFVWFYGSGVHKLSVVGYMFEASLPVLHQLINLGRRHVQTSPWYRYVSFHLLLPWLACFNAVIHILYLLTPMDTNRIEKSNRCVKLPCCAGVVLLLFSASGS